ncbi:DUF2069 domain-containing protein [Corticimicrobacter populi]|uniref:DUF2069 domain-containing protein n=1 Tax=Corticimicrobacter populi TaxID=2175229 RepID=A0A2V1JZL4_9BURK|nr:DUF2069 domain-containing protein [Corticimicrobacter populi]PWF23206.1 DUF2069 domain-containing protein [Corticimicrobacter populi]
MDHELNPRLNPRLRQGATFCLLALIVLCVLWETVLAPIRPGGSWLFLKALPLAFPLRGVARGNLYTYQWASMLILLYVMEAVVRVMSDPPGPSIALAWIELALSVGFFFCAIFYVRPAKKAARTRQRMQREEGA